MPILGRAQFLWVTSTARKQACGPGQRGIAPAGLARYVRVDGPGLRAGRGTERNLEDDARLAAIQNPPMWAALGKDKLMYIGIGTIVVIVIIVLVILMLRRLCPQPQLIPICRVNFTRRHQEAAGGKPMGAEET